VDQGVGGEDGILDEEVAAGGVNLWLAEEHREGDGFAVHPCVGFGEHSANQAMAAELMGDTDLRDAADTGVATAGGDDFVMGGSVGDEVAGCGADEPAVGGGFADVPAGKQDGGVRKTGEKEAAQLAVLRVGDLRLEAVGDEEFPAG